MATFSKTKVRKSGSTIRRYARGEASDAELEDALVVIVGYRAAFSEPTGKMQDLLRNLLDQQGLEGDVTQRIKKLSTIIEKLRDREQKLDLSRMQDIGGCRVVLPSINDVRQFETALLQTLEGPAMKHDDYIASPRSSGYRAVHVVHEQFGPWVEVQLRSSAMHEWAMVSEALSNALGINLKQDGDHPVQVLLKEMGGLFRVEEEGDDSMMTEELEAMLRRYTRARSEAQPYLDQVFPGQL